DENMPFGPDRADLGARLHPDLPGFGGDRARCSLCRADLRPGADVHAFDGNGTDRIALYTRRDGDAELASRPHGAARRAHRLLVCRPHPVVVFTRAVGAPDRRQRQRQRTNARNPAFWYPSIHGSTPSIGTKYPSPAWPNPRQVRWGRV